MNADRVPAVILDRDGVVNKNRADYVRSWNDFQFLEGSLTALRKLALTRFRVVVVSNQSAIGRGLVERRFVQDIHRLMLDRIAQAGGRVDGVFYCPHRPEDGCSCRKPLPGLVLQASQKLDLDLARSYFVGDSVDDIVAAQAAGCTPILVLTGRGEEAAAGLARFGLENTVVVKDLLAAVEWIQGREPSPESQN